MKTFRVYAKSTTYYVAEVEAESAEAIDLDDMASDEFDELEEITWAIDEIIEVKPCNDN